MAAPRKPKAKKLKFELTRSAVAGIGVVVFCLFLWMFLLGVWAGQSLLLPSYEKKTLVAEEKGKALGPLVIRAEKKATKKAE
jgi:hypothetical protein